MYKLKLSHYLGYVVLMGCIYACLILLMNGQKVTVFDSERTTTTQIIAHNFFLFIKWQVFFIASPLYWLFETLVLSWIFKTGIITYGFEQVVDKLWRHGLIELPNVCLYQLLSFRMLYYWWKSKHFRTIKDYLYANKIVYLFSITLILIAGLIEGVQWKK